VDARSFTQVSGLPFQAGQLADAIKEEIDRA
jgi:hypothetical protein